MIFVDSDIFLDTVLIRMPYAHYSDILFSSYSDRNLKLATSSHCLVNVYYFAKKTNGVSFAKSLMAELTGSIKVFSVKEIHLLEAVKSTILDFEDAVQHEIALSNQCNAIITRNLKHYKNSKIPVYTAEQYLNTL